ncbi:alpha/beta fold hydrolase [Plantactinospora siamensis]|uniref:Alpha/beta fold hydrolase n=1 Tax=Plantactinospora siamensis TaxID=555372 RepID=A0ABV6NR13_9ACTN
MPSLPTMLLVHSPLLTCATWDAVRPWFAAAGWRVVVPDLRPVIDAPSFYAAACATAAADVPAGAPTVIVGHSRAGAYLPGIAEAVGGDRLTVVFLDARLPYPGTSWVGSMPPERAAWLRRMAGSGRLPAWHTWFPEDPLDELLPDPDQRRRVLDGMPELPWRVVTEVLPAAGGAWESARRVYLQLSEAYRGTGDEAEERGYLVRRRNADHLAMVTRPGMVTELVLATLAD